MYQLPKDDSPDKMPQDFEWGNEFGNQNKPMTFNQPSITGGNNEMKEKMEQMKILK